MDVTLREPADRQRLEERVRTQREAKQRDRCRAVLLALDGHEAVAIAAMLGRSRRFVQDWAYAYRDGGVEAIASKPRSGRPTKLPRGQEEAFRQRMLAGPAAADGGVCVLRGLDAVAVLEREFGVKYSLNGAYDLLHRLGFSCLRPRPRHRKNDPPAMARWLADAPLLSSK